MRRVLPAGAAIGLALPSASSSASLDAILKDLQAVDGATSQGNSDLSAGTSAQNQSDEP